MALELLLLSILTYLPPLLTANTDTAEGAGQALGSGVGLVYWEFVFFILVVVTADWVPREPPRGQETPRA